VTDFEYELHDVGPEVFFVAVFYPRSVAAGVLRFIHRPQDVIAIVPIGVQNFRTTNRS
jgi:hypothetical protein